MELFFSFSGLVNALSSTILGLIVYFKNKKSVVNQSFAMFCFAIALWSYPYIAWPLAETAESTLLWFQLLHIGAIFIPVFYLFFLGAWLGIYKRIRKMIYFALAFSLFFLFSIFTPYFITEVVPKFSLKFWAEPGIIYHFYILYFFIFSIYSFYLLYDALKSAKGAKKAQIKLSLIGVILNFIGGSTNFFLWYDINLPPFGNILASSYVLFTAYAIIRYRFMDIRFALRNTSVYALSILSLSVLVFVLHFVLNRIIFFNEHLNDLLLLIFVAFSFPFLRSNFQKLSNKYVFSSLYDSREIVSKINKDMAGMLDAGGIFIYLYNIFSNALSIGSIAVLIKNPERGDYAVNYKKSDSGDFLFFNNINIKKVKISNAFEDKFFRKVAPIFIEEAKDLENLELLSDFNMFSDLGVEIVLPLKVKSRLIGMIVFGRKSTGHSFNNEDFNLLNLAGKQVAVYIENALLYEEIKSFNKKLGSEVKEATKKYIQANKKLKKIDLIKNNFITIASHKFRTPLSIIKGYSSLILEDNSEKLDSELRANVECIQKANKRLIVLVEELISISVADSGMFRFDFEPGNIMDVVSELYEEFITEARKKGLIFKLSMPKKISEIDMDKNKMKKAIFNLIDNAVKYTKTGSIAIDLFEKEDKVVFKIADSGIGIDEKEKNNLFDKFFRGKRVGVFNTEGIGLGLYFTKKVLTAHHGRIYAHSKGVDAGSDFIFEIPIK